MTLRCVHIAGCVVASLWLGCAEESVEPAQNLVLISIDTLRPDKLSAYGYPRETTPFLDEFAAHGTLFLNAFSTSPWTLPAHGSLLTGLYPIHHGAKSASLALASRISTLAQILAAQGFRTAAFVNSLFLSRRSGFNRGFDEYRYVPSDSHLPSVGMAKRAIKWLTAKEPERFFLFLHDYQTHSDYVSLPRYQKNFTKPYNGAALGTTKQLKAFRNGQFPLEPRDVEHIVDLYVSGVRQMDAELGVLLKYLESAGYWENTLIIITSDHGEEFLEHDGVLHGRTQYDELLRVPLVMRGPGVPEAARVAEPVSLIDVAPTALSLMKIPHDIRFDGVDLFAGAEDGENSQRRDRVLFGEADHKNQQNDIMRSARLRGFKLILNRLTGESEFYETQGDPGEQHPLSDRHPEMQRILLEEIEGFDSNRVKGEALPALDPETRRELEALGYLQ